MSVQTQINRITDNVTEQSELINQIKSGLIVAGDNIIRTNNEVSAQSDLIQQIKSELAVAGENIINTSNEIYAQSDLIAQIQAALADKAAGGIELPELENQGYASELFEGKELIDGSGNVVTGTFTIENELTSQNELIAQIQAALVGKAAAGGIELPELENQGYASELFEGKELIDGSGNVVTGTFTIENELTSQNELIAQIQAALVGKASGSGGGLPSGLFALACGEVTPTQDTTSGLTVTHNLGVTPNFCLWWDTTDLSGSDTKTNMLIWGIVVCKNVYDTSSAKVVNYLYDLYGYGSSGSMASSTGRITNTTDMTSATVKLRSESSRKLIAGHTYKWICGVM